MRRLGAVLLAGGVVGSCLLAARGWAANVVVTDSKIFSTSQSACTVGVWVTNDVDLTGFSLPLELRSGSPASYPITYAFAFRALMTTPGRRVPTSPLKGSVTFRTLGEPAAHNSCSGPVSHTFSTNKAFDGISPDGFLWAGVSTSGSPDLFTLPPGTDSVAGTFVDWPAQGEVTDYLAKPSFFFAFTTSDSVGDFEIDTCCVTPAYHLETFDINVSYVPFDFVEGVIQVISSTSNQPPNAVCQNVNKDINAGLCTAVVTPAEVNNGSTDPEGGALALELVPPGPYAKGATNVQLIVTDGPGAKDTCDAAITVYGGALHIHIPEDYPTIQAGINAACSGDTVLVASGTYHEAISFLGKAITVRSEAGPTTTILDGTGLSDKIATFRGSETRSAVLEGFTIQNSAVAAVWCDPGSPTLRGNIFQNDHSGYGGAVTVFAGDPLIEENTFLGNSSSDAGGAVLIYGSAATLQRNTFVGNWAGNGGAVHTRYSSARLIRNVFARNAATGPGAAYVASSDSRDSVINNTFYDNSGPTGVLAIWYCNSVVALNNILAYNSGVGILQQSSGGWNTDYNLLYGNTGGGHAGLAPGPNDQFADPLFIDTSALDLHLWEDSPCIDAGHPDVQFNDPDGSRNDIGALPCECDRRLLRITAISVGYPEFQSRLTNHTPWVAWSHIDSSGNPLAASAVQVGSDADWSAAELWDVPDIPGADTSIQYAGDSLEDGVTYYLRVRARVDSTWSPWRGATFHMNGVPFTPSPWQPPDRNRVLVDRPMLTAANVTDPEYDSCWCTFELYRDSLLASPVEVKSGVPATFQWASWIVDSAVGENEWRWWRARAFDGYEYGPWSGVYSFVLDAVNNPPGYFDLQSPPNHGFTNDLAPLFVWHPAPDPDPYDTMSYTIRLALDSNLLFAVQIGGIIDTSYVWPQYLYYDTRFWWRIDVHDAHNGSGSSPIWTFVIHSPCACPCHGDPQCDSVANLQDVVKTVDVAFRGGASVTDPLCPRERTDVSCDGVTTVVDVVKAVNVAFRGANPTTEFCDPCGM